MTDEAREARIRQDVCKVWEDNGGDPKMMGSFADDIAFILRRLDEARRPPTITEIRARNQGLNRAGWRGGESLMEAAELLAYMGTEASKWASEFNKTARDLGYRGMDEDWLLGWFACAIEAGRDAACRLTLDEIANGMPLELSDPKAQEFICEHNETLDDIPYIRKGG